MSKESQINFRTTSERKRRWKVLAAATGTPQDELLAYAMDLFCGIESPEAVANAEKARRFLASFKKGPQLPFKLEPLTGRVVLWAAR
jgi:hypothetical protein